VQYILGRGLPKSCLAELMYAHDFTKVGKKIDPEYFPNTRREDPRIVIPFFDRSGNFIGVQGRTMNPRESLRYITLKPKGQEKLWYGLWKVDATQRVYVVEGPLDSMILPNAIAMVGANASDDLPDFLAHSDLVFVLDNEPRNKQIVEYNEELIESGKQVCIWPDGIAEKDINEMLGTRSAESIRQMVDNHTYRGLSARVNLNRWRRI
jgi:DNA primase